MPKIIRNIYRDDLPPQQKDVLWENILDNKLYSFRRGEWVPLGGGKGVSADSLTVSKYNDEEIKALILNNNGKN